MCDLAVATSTPMFPGEEMVLLRLFAIGFCSPVAGLCMKHRPRVSVRGLDPNAGI